jgi:hypothetical protein
MNNVPLQIKFVQKISLPVIYLLLFVPKRRVCINCAAAPLLFHVCVTTKAIITLREELYIPVDRIIYLISYRVTAGPTSSSNLGQPVFGFVPGNR